MIDPIVAFKDAIAAARFIVPETIVGDGRIHRFSTGQRRGDDSGWYVLHTDGVPAGAFGDWRQGMQSSWCAKSADQMTIAEREANRRRIKSMQGQRDAEERERHAQAGAAAATRWAAALPALSHPYLKLKRVRSHGLRLEAAQHTLLVPVRDPQGRLHSLQSISPDGTKRFMPGGRVRGCYHAIGKPSGKLAIAEGYATAATIHQDTGHAVAVAFNSGNLLPVAQALRDKYPSLIIVICADDDWKTTGNPGLTAAREAAAAIGGLLAVPDFAGLPRADKDTDFNDLHRLAGAVVVQA